MTQTWVLVLVTAITPFEFNVTPLVHTDSMAQCYFQSTVAEFDIVQEYNKELLCIRVDDDEVQ